MKTKKKTLHFFCEGAIAPEIIANDIARHSSKTGIGAHSIFLGQVRSDVVGDRSVAGIEYSCYREMAEEVLGTIREETILKYNLSCAHVHHSNGWVKTGEISLFVFTSSPHRHEAINACAELVERIKNEVPVFGKERFTDETFQWKTNH
jgi:molybdopterin synthase catalytic subunit